MGERMTNLPARFRPCAMICTVVLALVASAFIYGSTNFVGPVPGSCTGLVG